MDPPFTRLDLLSRRNLLSHLKPERQQKLIALFHYSLNPGAVLLLGNAETVAQAAGLFAQWLGKKLLYRRLAGLSHDQLAVRLGAYGHLQPLATGAEVTAPVVFAAGTRMSNLKQLGDDLLLQRFGPVASGHRQG
jgi:two-component system CheB/CheR fusion protein